MLTGAQLKKYLTHPDHHEIVDGDYGRDVELRNVEVIDRWSNEMDRALIESLLIQSRYVCTHGFASAIKAVYNLLTFYSGIKNKQCCSYCARWHGIFQVGTLFPLLELYRPSSQSVDALIVE